MWRDFKPRSLIYKKMEKKNELYFYIIYEKFCPKHYSYKNPLGEAAKNYYV